MDLVEEIIKRTELEKNKEVWKEEYALFHFFLGENINALFGKTFFDSQELELMRTINGIQILYNGENYFITIRILGPSYIEISCTKKEINGYILIFHSTINKEEAVNNLSVKGNIYYEYLIDREREQFSFSKYGNTSNFSGSMQPMHIGRNKEYQVFSLCIMEDENEEKSLFKRFFPSKKTTVRLPIEATVENTLCFVDEIFACLKKISNPTKKSKEKKLEMK